MDKIWDRKSLVGDHWLLNEKMNEHAEPTKDEC